jgi:hypothetical protein
VAKVKLEVWGYRCERCGHEWIPRDKDVPRICPKCKSPYWDRPRKADNPVIPVLRSIVQTPGVFLVSIRGRYSLNGRSVPLDVSHKPESILGVGFKLPADFHGTFYVYGKFSIGARPTLKNAIEEINRLRRAERLEPLSDGVVCERLDAKHLPPEYALSLSVLPTADQSTDRDQLDD